MTSILDEIEFIDKSSVSPIDTSENDASRVPDNRELIVASQKVIISDDPFQTLDQNGVGQLVKMAVEKGRSVKKDLKIGICGEHGGDPQSVKFCHRIGLTYVSCSPYRVPIAKLAAAQAVIEEKEKI